MILYRKLTGLYIFILISLISSVQAQNVDSIFQVLTKKTQLDHYATPTPDLFLHTDKAVYNPGEQIWLAAYLVNKTKVQNNKIFHVLLVNEVTHKIERTQNFLLESGLGYGSFNLPDSLKSGSYSLLAYTDEYVETTKGLFFRVALTIVGEQVFLKPVFTVSFKDDSLFFTGKLMARKDQVKKPSAITAKIYAEGKVLYNLSQKIDNEGVFKFVLPKTLASNNLEMVGMIKYGDEWINIKNPIRWHSQTEKDPLTNTVPAPWKVVSKNIITDTLQVGIISPLQETDCTVLIENGRNMLFGTHIVLPKGSGRFSIATNDWPEGIATLSVFNKTLELESKKPIYVNRKKAPQVTLHIDSTIYKSKSKVNVSIKLADHQGQPLQGVFSLSVVLKQVHDNFRSDIVRYSNYDRFLPTGLPLPSPNHLKKNENIENTLSYLTQQQLHSNVQIAKNNIDSVDGYVLYHNKPLKKAVTLILLGTTTTLLSTDAVGNFSVPPELLIAAPGEKITLGVAEKSPSGYRLILKSRFAQTDKSLAERYFEFNPFKEEELTAEQIESLRSTTSNNLKEVVITGNSKTFKNYQGKADSSGMCDDYVCRLNFLNCLSHPRGAPGTTIPQDGQRYLIDGVLGTEEVTYHCKFMGLQPYIKTLETIDPYSTFPVFNPTDLTFNENPKRTTLHWQQNIQTDLNGEAQISFFTNERPGDYIIGLQGISASGVFSKQIDFGVKK